MKFANAKYVPSLELKPLCYYKMSIKSSVPAKVVSSHLVELQIKRSVEFPESVQHLRWYVWMRSSFRFPQTPWSATPLWLFQARKAFRLVKVEVLVGHHPFQTQKVLHPPHFPRGVRDEFLSAHEKKLGEREIPEPVLQVFSINSDPNSAPGSVNQTGAGVLENQVLKSRQTGVFGQSLSVVRYGPGHGVADHHDELGGAAHGEDAVRGFMCDEVAGGLLHGDLAF